MAALSLQCLSDASDTSESIIEDITDLCDSCIKLTEAMVTDPGEPLGGRGQSKHVIENSTRGSGPETCRLCEIITNNFDTQRQHLGVAGPFLTPVDWRKSDPIMSRQYRNSGVFSSDPVDPRQICGTHISRDHETGIWAHEGSDWVDKYSIWADEGTPATAALIDRPPILGPHMNKVCGLVQRWQKECNVHTNCTADDDTPMPTRVLALCGDDTRPSVQLIESRGRKGRYLALSHCWGSIEKRPLQTTSENYQVHQHGIAFGDLPKTFQDTVELAQGIGIKYVWIDSLCIIQGNSQDWHSEAVKMGDVYWNAALVVAASGAKDSSQGLFISERPVSTVLRLPYTVAGECKGTSNMMKSPMRARQYDCHPPSGPLERRVWTLQERYLARRLTTFMPSCISWACNMATVTETGNPISLFYREQNWCRLLSEYTTRSLTVAADRIEALRGIGQLYQRYREDRYIPEYGVWEEDLVFQLLWFNTDPRFDNGELAKMPSWSWAATGGAKRWPDEGTDPAWNSTRAAEEISERFSIIATGHLQIFGHLSTIQPAPSYVQDELTVRDLGLSEMYYHYDSWNRNSQGFHVLTQVIDGSSDEAVLGIARFDNNKSTTYTHACILSKQKDRSEELGYSQGKRFVERNFIARARQLATIAR